MRDTRKGRLMKWTKNIERLLKDAKCRECAVVVTRMDFAKILGKFTKVKVRYESSSTQKEKQNLELSRNGKSKLKANENGVIHSQKKMFNQPNNFSSSRKTTVNNNNSRSPNVLKENNRLKKTVNNRSPNNKVINSIKEYGIVFEDPANNNKDLNSKITLLELLPHIDINVLPSDDWLIDYFPKKEEVNEDKVYDRIAAELEDLMYNEKTKDGKLEANDNKIDEFPTIMDILNENINDVSKPDEQSNVEFKTNLESSDVEAMLLGKSNNVSADTTPMEVDTQDISNVITNVNQLNDAEEAVTAVTETNEPKEAVDNFDNPHSPSILDETLQKGIEEHLPPETHTSPNGIDVTSQKDTNSDDSGLEVNKLTTDGSSVTVKIESETLKNCKETKLLLPLTGVEELIFKKTINGKCLKSVTCPKNLKYSIVLENKPVEFLGAPKYISSLEDLQVLLQIVNETELENLYVLQ